MKIDRQDTTETTIFTFHGRLDATTSGVLESEFANAYHSGYRLFVWDLGQLDYISSAGLRPFLQAMKQLEAGGGHLALCSPSHDVREVFEISGFGALLDIHPHRASAVARCLSMTTARL